MRREFVVEGPSGVNTTIDETYLPFKAPGSYRLDDEAEAKVRQSLAPVLSGISIQRYSALLDSFVQTTPGRHKFEKSLRFARNFLEDRLIDSDYDVMLQPFVVEGTRYGKNYDFNDPQWKDMFSSEVSNRRKWHQSAVSVVGDAGNSSLKFLGPAINYNVLSRLHAASPTSISSEQQSKIWPEMYDPDRESAWGRLNATLNVVPNGRCWVLASAHYDSIMHPLGSSPFRCKGF